MRACPFCGGAIIDMRDDPPLVMCVCRRCEATASCAEEWNTRPIEDALRSRVERLEGALRFYANDDSWRWNYDPDGDPVGSAVIDDCGVRAREALEGGERG